MVVGNAASQYAAAVLSYEHVIFDSYAEFSRDIYARLDCKDHTSFQPAFCFFSSMTGSSCISRPKTMPLSRDHTRADYTWRLPYERLHRPFLISTPGFIISIAAAWACCTASYTFFVKGTRLTYGKASGNVTAVTFIPGTEVYQYSIVFP